MNSVRRLTVRMYVPKRSLVKTSKPRSGLQEYFLKNFKNFLALELDGPSDQWAPSLKYIFRYLSLELEEQLPHIRFIM